MVSESFIFLYELALSAVFVATFHITQKEPYFACNTSLQPWKLHCISSRQTFIFSSLLLWQFSQQYIQVHTRLRKSMGLQQKYTIAFVNSLKQSKVLLLRFHCSLLGNIKQECFSALCCTSVTRGFVVSGVSGWMPV